MTKQNRPVGVIGTGLMGTACAKRLIAAGFDVLGFDADPAKLKAIEALGGRPGRSAAEVAGACDTVVLAVFNTDQ
jgi:3-hydroxyisobutyrate dehydrogenase-like beta-hydroxyacid dehydrogenase